MSASYQDPLPFAQIGSLRIFWPFIEPLLNGLAPRRVCEIGMAGGSLTAQLLQWGSARGCHYVGIDPAPDSAAAAWFAEGAPGTLRAEPSLAALPTLEPCDAYFIDGDHNYHTVRAELSLIAAAGRRPLIFLHDVTWPWARRDMYYLPSSVPAEARHPSSETLGIVLEQAELVEGGMREPGHYAIALHAGGPRNGVLTAVEDFLASAEGSGWESLILPVAYGLGILWRPGEPAFPAACREQLESLRAMNVKAAPFFAACEENYLRLYLYGESVAEALRRQTPAETAAGKPPGSLAAAVARVRRLLAG